MARRNSNRSNAMNSAIANRRLLDTITTQYFRIPSMPSMAPVTDRRTYHPARVFRPVQVSGTPGHRLRVPHKFKPQLPWQLAFHDPKRIAVCVRRKVRAQVLHAFRLTGKGSRARSRKRNQYSSISCRG